MATQVEFCVVCAWRETCQKKYTVSGDPIAKCAEFSRDVRIKKDKPDAHKPENTAQKKK